jgi:uncharacterized integral membrane protein
MPVIRFLKALVLLPIAVLIVLLAVANRQSVTLSLDPFSQAAPEFSVDMPLFAVLFLAVMAGVMIGGVAAWLAQGKHRRERRRYRREASSLRYETDRLKAEKPRGNLPAIPPSQTALF